MKNLDTASMQKLAVAQLRQRKLSKGLKTIDRAIKTDKKMALSHFSKLCILQGDGKLKPSN